MRKTTIQDYSPWTFVLFITISDLPGEFGLIKNSCIFFFQWLCLKYTTTEMQHLQIRVRQGQPNRWPINKKLISKCSSLEKRGGSVTTCNPTHFTSKHQKFYAERIQGELKIWRMNQVGNSWRIEQMSGMEIEINGNILQLNFESHALISSVSFFS